MRHCCYHSSSTAAAITGRSILLTTHGTLWRFSVTRPVRQHGKLECHRQTHPLTSHLWRHSHCLMIMLVNSLVLVSKQASCDSLVTWSLSGGEALQSLIITYTLTWHIGWRGSLVVSVLDQRPRGRGFECWIGALWHLYIGALEIFLLTYLIKQKIYIARCRTRSRNVWARV